MCDIETLNEIEIMEQLKENVLGNCAELLVYALLLLCDNPIEEI